MLRGAAGLAAGAVGCPAAIGGVGLPVAAAESGGRLLRGTLGAATESGLSSGFASASERTSTSEPEISPTAVAAGVGTCGIAARGVGRGGASGGAGGASVDAGGGAGGAAFPGHRPRPGHQLEPVHRDLAQPDAGAAGHRGLPLAARRLIWRCSGMS